MYKITQEYKDYIETKTSISPKCKIIVDGIEYTGNIIKIAPKIKHKNDNIIGGFPTKTCSFDIYDLNNEYDFCNKEISVYKGIMIGGKVEYIPQGIFIPTSDKIETNITNKIISFKDIQDKTQLFDIPYVSTLDWSKQHSGLEIIQEICKIVNVPLETENFNWADYMFKQPNFKANITCREAVSRLAEIGGNIAFINRTGNLVIKGQESTNHKVDRKRYEKVTEENLFGPFNTVVLGKEGINDDIIYPENVDGERIEYKILDNPYVDLYRKEMIEEVSKYILGMKIKPYTLTNFVDGFYLDLNDVIQITDKNNNTFDAVILNYESSSRIKSNISSSPQNNGLTKYNLAGSNKQSIRDIQVDVNHINAELVAQAKDISEQKSELAELKLTTESIETSVKKIEPLEEQVNNLANSIELFSVDLDSYILVIPADGNTPLETKEYTFNHYSYFKGKQVQVVPKFLTNIEGITITTTQDVITISVDSSTPIGELSSELEFQFDYIDGEDTYSIIKKINVSLAPKGIDGKDGKDGKDGEPGKDGTPGEPGAQGPKGDDGSSTYFYVKYSENSNGNPMTDVPNDKTQYMGVASTTSATSPTSYSAYTWSRIKGNDGASGTPGQPGADGKTSYLHIKYSEDGQTFTPADEDLGYGIGEKPSAWYGQYVDYTEADSPNFEDYTWYKFTESIDGTLDDLQKQINDNSANIQNNYSDLIKALTEKADISKIDDITTQVKQLQTDTYTKTEIQQIANGTGVDGVTVSAVISNEAMFDINGMHYSRSDKDTATTVNYKGLEVDDKTGNELLFAGVEDGTDNSIVRTDNLTVKTYLRVANNKARIEEYTDEDGNDGVGCFLT